MTAISNGLQYTVQEWAYLGAHCGFKLDVPHTKPHLGIAVAISTKESGRHSGEYRPEISADGTVLNPSGGDDLSGFMLNTRYQKINDMYRRFDTLFQWRDVFRIVTQQSLVSTRQYNGWWPWSYGPGVAKPRPDIELAAVTTQIGNDPYNISKSPYWRMVKAGIDVGDMPVPPRDVYVSRLPQMALKSGSTGTAGTVIGDAVHQLGLILVEDGLWTSTTPPYWYYGNTTVVGVKAKQTYFAGLGLWAGPIDGIYSDPFRRCWDGALHYLMESGI